MIAMEREQVLAILKANEPELRASGVLSISLIGSVARRESPARDIDVVVRLRENFSQPGFDYFTRLDNLERRLSEILGCKVDVIEEPVRKERFQKEIDRDRALAF